MTDARRLSTIRSWIESMSLAQEVVVLAGVVLFLGALATSSGLWRIILLLVSAAAISYVVLSRWRQGGNRLSAVSDESSPSEEQQDRMKKLVFDDLQAAGKQYRIQFIEEPSAASTAPDQRSPAPETTGIGIPSEPTTREFQVADFLETLETESSENTGPRAEFTGLMKRLLTVVKDSTFAHSVCLFWVNREKKQLVLESFVTDSGCFTSHRRLELGSDLVSQVALAGKPQMVNYLSPHGLRDMLPYYEGEEGVKTFVGVPVYLSASRTELPVAVLAVDCLENDAYGDETMSLLAQFTKLISSLTRSYTDKYDMLLDSEVLRSLARLRDQYSMDLSAPNITRTLAEETSKLVPWDYISVVIYDDGRKAWVVQQVSNRMNDPYIPALSEIDLHHSLVGSAIESSVAKIVDRLDSLAVPRFYQAERCEFRGSMLVVPLTSLGRCYGALAVESKDPRSYSESDARLLQKIAVTAAWALEILSLTEIMNNYVSLDEATGVSTRKHFLERLQEEVLRSNDFGTDLSMVMVSIDGMEEHVTRHGKDAFDVALQSVGRMIKTSVRGYDVVGRFDFNRFVVALVNTTANEAALWAEKIRKNVASNIINIDNKSFSVTVSIGVAGAAADISDLELLEHADRVLKKAVESGGNLVRVY